MPRPGTAGPRYREFLIEELMPKREIHMIAGASGVGKTTFLLPMIDRLSRGEAVFGCKCRPAGTTILCADRSVDAYKRSIERCGFRPEQFTFYSLRDPDWAPLDIGQCLEQAHRLHPENECVVIEAIMMLVPGGDPNKFSAVGDFISRARSVAARLDLTVIGTGHVTKTKANEMILDARQRILGSVAWASFCDCLIVITAEDPENSGNPNRIISLLPRDYPNRDMTMYFKAGVLADGEAPIPTELMNNLFALFEEEFADGSFVRRKELEQTLGDIAGRTTVNRWIKEAQSLGYLKWEKRGVYRVTHKPLVV